MGWVPHGEWLETANFKRLFNVCYEKTRPEVVGRGENPELSGLFGIKNLGTVKFWHNYLCPSLMEFFIGICVSLGVQDWEQNL